MILFTIPVCKMQQQLSNQTGNDKTRKSVVLPPTLCNASNASKESFAVAALFIWWKKRDGKSLCPPPRWLLMPFPTYPQTWAGCKTRGDAGWPQQRRCVRSHCWKGSSGLGDPSAATWERITSVGLNPGS